MSKFAIIYMLTVLLLVSSVNGATIYGTIYDISLKKINNVVVEIDTKPKQFMVSQNGSYSFNVPQGTYIIKARLMLKNTTLAYAEENVTIQQEGSYVIDLILFPDIEEEEEIEDLEIDIDKDSFEVGKNNIIVYFFISFMFILLIIILFFYISRRKQTKEEATRKEELKEATTIEENVEKKQDYELEQIIDIIKQEGGRATQKDIRKQIPLSEAKVSLMIAELEHKGIIEKIKKGRGNIIILKK